MAKKVLSDIVERLTQGSTFNPDTGCITWDGAKLKGYGVVTINGKARRVHVVAWEAANGPTPPGLELDHRCHSDNPCGLGDNCPHRACWNVTHLVPRTHAENVLLGESPSAINARKTHCDNDHPLASDNLYIIPSTGGRVCRQCRADWREANRQAPASLRAKSFTIAALLGADATADPLIRLADLHSQRDGDNDPRCRTCRDSKARPAPWPCVTYVEVAAALGEDLDRAALLKTHNAGRVMNGLPELRPTWTQKQVLSTTTLS